MPEERPWTRPLQEILEIEHVRDGVFTACLGGFGGETLGCATLAAARTCDEKPLHSLHTYFLRPVTSDQPVEFVVDRVRDGRRLAHRRVQVRLKERLLCELMASFAVPGEGTEYQDANVHPDSVPEDLPSEEEVARAEGWNLDEPGPLGGPFDWRWIGGSPWLPDGPHEASLYRAWVRPRFPLPDEHAFRSAVLVFLADYHSHFSVARKLGAHYQPIGFASLDQSLWIQRDLEWNDWWLLTTESDVAHAGRALTRRMLYTRDGRVVASMAQEQLIPGAS